MNLREAWLRTELFSQKLALTAGRLDLTNYFDRNAAANDETTQFISDALVNNPMLGLATQRRGRRRRVRSEERLRRSSAGSSRATPTRRTCRDSIFSLAEVGLRRDAARAWPRATTGCGIRNDNSTDAQPARRAASASTRSSTPPFDPVRPVRDRHGAAGTDAFSTDQTSGASGFQFQNGVVFNPLDTWGVGYSADQISDAGDKEQLVEGYYNFQLSEKLRLSFHLQHSPRRSPTGAERSASSCRRAAAGELLGSIGFRRT